MFGLLQYGQTQSRDLKEFEGQVGGNKSDGDGLQSCQPFPFCNGIFDGSNTNCSFTFKGKETLKTKDSFQTNVL
jgi:hypothetical protein